MMTDQHNLDVMIAETLEKVQHINPELYGHWYSKLYAPHGDITNWNQTTLTALKQLFL